MSDIRPILAGVLSMLLPGAGQVYAGRAHRGYFLLGITLALLGTGLTLWLQGPMFLLSLLVRPAVLIGLLAANLAFLVFRLYAVVDAYGSASNHSGGLSASRHVSPIGVLAVLLVLTALPHAVAGYYNLKGYEVLTTLFPRQVEVSTPVNDNLGLETPSDPIIGGEMPVLQQTPPTSVAQLTSLPPPVIGEPTVAERPQATQTPTQAMSVVGEDPSEQVSTPTTEPPTPTQPAALPTSGEATPWEGDDHLNILLLGGDAGEDRRGIRTDTMIVASVEPKTGRAALFQVPRNLVGVPLPKTLDRGWPCRCWPWLLNALYGDAHAFPEVWPGDQPGADAIKAVIGNLLGVEIDYYALVDLRGFESVVDALGGVTMNVPEPVMIRHSPPEAKGEWRYYKVPAGRQHFTGTEALRYVRTRSVVPELNMSGNDTDRGRRQRCLLNAVARQEKVPALLRAFPRLVPVIKQNVQTDIPLDLLPKLIQLGGTIDKDGVVTTAFSAPTFNSGWIEGYPVPDVGLIRRTVRATFQESQEGLPKGTRTLEQSC